MQRRFPISVFDEDGTRLGEFHADLLVENRLIVQVVAVKAIENEHTARILGYLRASRREHGLVMNFGGSKFQIRKYIMDLLPGVNSGS